MRLSLRGSVSQSFFDSTGTVAIERRTNVDLLTTWRATPYLSLNGDWSLTEDDLQRTLTQRYSASYTPGRKLSTSFSRLRWVAVMIRVLTGISLELPILRTRLS